MAYVHMDGVGYIIIEELEGNNFFFQFNELRASERYDTVDMLLFVIYGFCTFNL